MRRLPALTLILSLFACGPDTSPTPDAGGSDAGAPLDAGAAADAPDAGEEADAGAFPDAGEEADAGAFPDAGEEADAGVTCPPGTFVAAGGGCEDCPADTFSTTENATACTSFRTCDDVETEGTPTSDRVCVADCVVEWSEWSCCFPAPNGPRQERTGTVVTPATPGGSCPSPLRERRECASDASFCCANAESLATCSAMEECRVAEGGNACEPRPIDCVYSSWSTWSACSRPCAGGTMSRTRTIVSEARNGGRACDTAPLVATQECNAGIPCECGFFADETTCGEYASISCLWSGGTCITTAPTSCETITDEATCNTSPLCCEFVFETCVPKTCG